jgi:hypothetical protein
MTCSDRPPVGHCLPFADDWSSAGFLSLNPDPWTRATGQEQSLRK